MFKKRILLAIGVLCLVFSGCRAKTEQEKFVSKFLDAWQSGKISNVQAADSSFKSVSSFASMTGLDNLENSAQKKLASAIIAKMCDIDYTVGTTKKKSDKYYVTVTIKAYDFSDLSSKMKAKAQELAKKNTYMEYSEIVKQSYQYIENDYMKSKSRVASKVTVEIAKTDDAYHLTSNNDKLVSLLTCRLS